MFDFLLFGAIIFLVCLSSFLLDLDLAPEYPTEYELKRRARDGDAFAKKNAWVKKHASEVNLVLKVLFLVSQGLFIVLASFKIGKVWPALVISALSFMVLRVMIIRGIGSNIFNYCSKFFVKHAQDLVGLFKPLIKPLYRHGSKNKARTESHKSFYSEDEFMYRFGLDSDVLSDSVRNKVERIIKSSKTRSKEIMIKIDSIPKIDANLELTPIIYDELHKKGYDMALVFQGSEDSLVGLLYLSGPEAVGQLNSSIPVRVADKMEQGMQYVTEDVKLDDLIAGFLQGGQNAVLVTGAGGRVSGVVTSKKLLAWVSGK